MGDHLLDTRVGNMCKLNDVASALLRDENLFLKPTQFPTTKGKPVCLQIVKSFEDNKPNTNNHQTRLALRFNQFCAFTQMLCVCTQNLTPLVWVPGFCHQTCC